MRARISPYARRGYIDHQTLSFDAYTKFIEDDFLNGERLDPAIDGRPDPRPDVREDQAILGDLTADFDFSQAPRPPLLLPYDPQTTPTHSVPFSPFSVTATAGTGRVDVRWLAPSTDGGAPIEHYVVSVRANGVDQSPCVFGANSTEHVITGLKHGTYTFTVRARNAVGLGYPSLRTRPVVVS